MTKHTPHRTRRVVAGLLVVLFALLLPITVTSAWTHRTVLDTDTYVSTVAPIAQDKAVIAAVSRDVTDQLYEALDPQAAIADSLPPRAAFLAGPIANAARSRVQEAVNRVLSSEQFQQLWENANRFAHRELVTVLRGDSSVLQTTQGQVVLNLVPLLSAALENASEFVSGVIGRPVTIPAITSDEAPAAACQKLSAALDRALSSTCGQIELFPSDDLEAAQGFVRAYDRAVIALLVLVPLVFAGALWASTRRRRTLLQLVIAGMAGLVVVRRLLFWQQDRLVDTGRPGNEDARRAIVNGLLGGFFDLTVWILVAGLVVVAVALLTGPYRWAVALRNKVRGEGRAETLSWVQRHVDAVRIGGVVVAAVLLLALDVNAWGLLAIGAALALFELWLHRLPPAVITLPTAVPRQTTSVDG